MIRILLFLFLILAVISGCSSSGAPVTPANDERSSTPTGSLDTLPIIEGTSYDDRTFQATGLMGAYELRVDPATMTADLVSKRIPSLGASWTVSGIGFFTIAPCSDCLGIESLALTADNYLQLHFAIRHPFKAGNTSLPPSAINRLDLDVFDLAAVIVPIGATSTIFPLTGTNAYAGFLADNAGLTTELANVVGDPVAMPYVLVVDDNAAGKNTWNEFPMGVESFFDVFFDLNTISALSFDMYLTMGYGQSAQGKAQRLTPTYFNPEFNRKQAWKVVVTPPQGSAAPAMGNTWQHNDDTTPYNVKVEVFDWQHGVTTIANPPVLPGDIAFASDVAQVSVEIPGMTNTIPSVSTPTSGTGGPATPLVFEVPVVNENLLGVGEYIGLVKVSDERVPQNPASGGTIDFLIDSPNGIALENYSIPAFATYQTFTATVVLGCGPITGSVVSPACPVNNVVNNSNLNFIVNASSANGGNPVTLYECDYDYDGTTFSSDFSNTTGIFNNVGPFTVPTPCDSNIPHDFIVAFRATDSCSPPNVTIFTTCTVTVTSCCVNPTVSTITPNRFLYYPGTYTGVSITGSNFQGSGGVTAINLSNGTSQINATNINVVSDTQVTCNITIGGTSFTGAPGLYNVNVTTQCSGQGANLATLENNILYYQNFSTGNGSCTSLQSFTYCSTASPPRWEESSPCGATTYPNLTCGKLITPTFNVPSYGVALGQCNDVTFRMRHSAYFEPPDPTYPACWDGGVAGWTPDGGTTFYGDTADGSNYWKYESGQNYNNTISYWYGIDAMGCVTANTNNLGWVGRNWTGTFGTLGSGTWSQFHLTGGENLFGMSSARFMLGFISDDYVGYRGWEIYELLVYYERP